MREAKYRGFSEDTGKWHFGHGHFLIKHTEESGLEDYSVLHTDGSPVYVVPESVGEYTALKDKNGMEIYEGDIYHQGDPKITYTVVWHDSGLIGKQNRSSSYAGLSYWHDRIEVIGNIYEHPHLLEVS